MLLHEVQMEGTGWFFYWRSTLMDSHYADFFVWCFVLFVFAPIPQKTQQDLLLSAQDCCCKRDTGKILTAEKHRKK